MNVPANHFVPSSWHTKVLFVIVRITIDGSIILVLLCLHDSTIYNVERGQTSVIRVRSIFTPEGPLSPSICGGDDIEGVFTTPEAVRLLPTTGEPANNTGDTIMISNTGLCTRGVSTIVSVIKSSTFNPPGFGFGIEEGGVISSRNNSNE